MSVIILTFQQIQHVLCIMTQYYHLKSGFITPDIIEHHSSEIAGVTVLIIVNIGAGIRFGLSKEQGYRIPWIRV